MTDGPTKHQPHLRRISIFVPKKRILAFSPLLIEDLSAESHVSFTSALNLFGRSVSDLFISCDNESKIKNIAEILSVPIISIWP